jgi:hypothetical protein
MTQPTFKIKACCLICARGEPEDGVVLCTYTNEAYREGWYCGLFMLRDLGQDIEQG